MNPLLSKVIEKINKQKITISLLHTVDEFSVYFVKGQHPMLKLALALLNEIDLTLTNHKYRSIICHFFIASHPIIRYQLNIFVMFFNSSSININHFEHLSSLMKTTIFSCNELFILTITIIINSSHSLKVFLKLINN
jgi:hypothetical protein